MRKSILLSVIDFFSLIYYAITAIILVLGVLASCAVGAGIITFAIQWFTPLNPDQVILCLFIGYTACMLGVIYVVGR